MRPLEDTWNVTPMVSTSDNSTMTKSPREPEHTSHGDSLERDVLFIAPSFPPVLQAGVFRTLRFLKYLPEFGWKPSVLTISADAQPDYLIRDESLSRQVQSGILVERTNVWRPYERATAPIKRLLRRPRKNLTESVPAEHVTGNPIRSARGWRNVLHGACDVVFHTPDADIGWLVPAVRRGIRMIREQRPSVLYATGPPHSSHLVGVALKSLTGIPLLLDLRDPWARLTWEEHTRGIRQTIQRWCESICVRHADHVILNTERLCENFQAAYPQLDPQHFSSVANGYDPALRHRIENLATSRPDPGQGPWTLCHAGGLYGKRDPRPLLEAIAMLNRAGHFIRFEQIGSVAEPETLQHQIRQNRLGGCVTIRDPMPHDSALHHLAKADAVLILQPGTSTQVPSKLFESILFNKPLLAITDTGSTRSLMEDYALGAVADSDSVEAIAQALQQVMQSAPESFSSDGRARALRDFNGETLTGQLHDKLNRIATPIVTTSS